MMLTIRNGSADLAPESAPHSSKFRHAVLCNIFCVACVLLLALQWLTCSENPQMAASDLLVRR
jgi:hypothetical protein